MTTAHRATWRAARGGDNEEGSFVLHVPSAAESAKAAPTERILKSREAPTSTREELRARLEVREGADPDEDALDKKVTVCEKRLRLSSGNEDVDGEEEKEAPDDRGGGEGEDSESGSESESDSEDDAAELQAELELIRAERAKTAAAAREAAAEAEAALAEAQAAKGNPLLGDLSASANVPESVVSGSTAGFAVKRKWNEDVVFRNQAKGERKVEQRFVNDTIRNDFHKRFLKRYMR